MPFSIFYSWQSKTANKYNRYFIEECLKDAIRDIKKDLKDSSPTFYIDRDTKDVPGRPNIPTTIDAKIKSCDVFVGDVSYVAYTNLKTLNGERTFWDKVLGRKKWLQEGNYSTNVAEELGTANGALNGSERIVTVMNTEYGTPDQLNFDSKQMRFPLVYCYGPSTTNEDRKIRKSNLVSGLKERIRRILETEHERQKDYFSPFMTIKKWGSVIPRKFPFEKTEYVDSIFSTINEIIGESKTIFRLCGLSGIGKTRMLFECFTNDRDNQNNLAGRLLYVDVKEQDDKDVIKTTKELLSKGENKILLVDNCSIDLHNSLINSITHEKSRLSLITVSTDPEETAAQLDTGRQTRLLTLDNQKCKQTVDQILTNNFSELQEDEAKLLVDFSSGISFVATLMADNPDRGKYQPGSLTREDVVKRLLGPIYADENSRSVVYACCLFSKFGFSDELAYQSDKIALNSDLFSINPVGIAAEDIEDWKKNKFGEVCKTLHERQLLERKGRTYSFRPSPLAVRMAEDWWRNCTAQKFQRILPVLKDANLIEGFCEQFRYLKHVENAKFIVQNLCDGFFSSAEVLDTVVGSRLFRSFVYVNPSACSNALTKAFLPLSTEVLMKFKEGRRNLVWALEKLCFREETFIQSTKVLAAFSVAENENIGNNATNQFLQLFHIQLPGTRANLIQRWQIIENCFEKSEPFQSLGISALSSALNVGHFSRMGGAEDQGDITILEDYRPSPREVWEYWQKSISLLETQIINSGIFKERAIEILKKQFYGLCSQGAGKLIIPVMESLIKNGQYDRMEARTQIQFISNSGRVFDQYSLENLNRIFDELSPASFSDKFEVLVQRPSYDEYVDEKGASTRGEKLLSKIDKLSDEFLQEKDNWIELSDNFFASHVAEGYNFGKLLSQKISSSDLVLLTDILLNKLKEAKAENKNIAVFSGVMAGSSNIEFWRKIFHQLLNDNELKHISFTIARIVQLPFDDILFLVNKVEKGEIPASFFNEFAYGWGIKHLQPAETIQFFEKLRNSSDDGKAVSFAILCTWTHNDEAFNKFQDLLRKIIIEDSEIILAKLPNTMDMFYYGEVVSKLLVLKEDDELAKKTIELIINQSNEIEYFYNKKNTFYKLIDILQKQYFAVVWNEISKVYLNIDTYGATAWHLKDLLGSHHDYSNHSEGLLFSGDPEKFEIIFEWCKKNTGRELYWIAELLPVFNDKRSTYSEWHPYALKFINEFGNDTHVLNSISAKIGTYSWVGSVIPKLQSDKALFTELLGHPKKEVREWATIHIEDIEKRIKWETNRDEDGIFE